MNSKFRLFKGVIGIVIILLFSISCKDDTITDPEEQYTGTLTVLQKDAYSDVAGRSSDLWPPHTTTVFKWDNGTEVQLNHGTAPEEVDAHGNPLLVTTKVYTFSSTKIEMELLQKAYKNAIYDDKTHKFLDLTSSTDLLEQSFLKGLLNYILDEVNNFTCTDSTTKDKIITYFKNNEFFKVIAELTSCYWTQVQWKIALDKVLGDVLDSIGHNISNYHVCNNDAALQVDLIKNYIATGKVSMPNKDYNGPMWFYTPN